MEFYNSLSGAIGAICSVAFTLSLIYLAYRHKREKQRLTEQ
jgi:hypothetical protein